MYNRRLSDAGAVPARSTIIFGGVEERYFANCLGYKDSLRMFPEFEI